MYHYRFPRIAACLCLAAFAALVASAPAEVPADTAAAKQCPASAGPSAPKETFAHRYHNQDYPDPYHWMRSSERKNDVLAHLAAENKYADSQLSVSGQLKDTLYNEMMKQVPVSYENLPRLRGAYEYYSKKDPAKTRDVHYRRRAGDANAQEEVILDLNQLSGEKIVLGALEPTLNGDLLAYSIDDSGTKAYTIHVKNLTSGEMLADTISGVTTNLEWDNSGRSLFYTQQNDKKRSYRALRHDLGADVSKDPVIFEEKDENFKLVLSRSKSGHHLFILCEGPKTKEWHYLDADQPAGAVRVIQPRVIGHAYWVESTKEQFIILTNFIDGKRVDELVVALRTCDVKGPTTMEHWTKVLEDDSRVIIETMMPFKGWLALVERFEGSMRLRAIKFDVNGRLVAKGEEHIAAFPEASYSINLAKAQPSYEQSTVRFTYISPISPKILYDYDMASRTLTERKKETVAGYDATKYVVERIYADLPASDGQSMLPIGTKVPIVVAYRRDLLRKDGSNPAYLTALGMNGTRIDTGLVLGSIGLMDRGFVVAHARVRGGGDNGYYWHRPEGVLLNKKNTFRDFIASAEKLFADRYTSKEKLVVANLMGDGLTLGPAINERPDLAKVVVLQIPLLDTLNALMDSSSPSAAADREELGDPTDAKYFEYIKSYSPYDNLKADVKYPNIYVSTVSDSEQFKFWGE
ncbi:prolyl oligopeptidase [Thamnocephalis sphaerospora]|uniref:Prolyl endopeptidase n=1 Tax=Thamnocephalis sphaerospora TaxID=78915 RepID=A0A4P9XHW6_9FUNG|nr:prolyl oligopeptidase [Thamnocephalis sphaerospora]|eukprot:RKP05304.1 prolyl oligopeptidase [Thamnocephalis sphaerospora]